MFALTRSAEQAAELARHGLEPLIGDVTRPETLVHLPAAETVLYAVGFDRGRADPRQDVQLEGLRHVLHALPDTIGRILYVGSTGVYGDARGAWIDEESPCRPTREAGRVLLAAEDLLRRHPLGGRAIVLRLAGMYGPGRLPRMADLLAGKPLTMPETGWLNLIHVDDAVRVVLAAEKRAVRRESIWYRMVTRRRRGTSIACWPDCWASKSRPS